MKRPHRRLLVAGIGAVLALLALGLVLRRIPAHRLEKNWLLVKPGMSKAEVELLLGTPACIYSAGHVESDSFLGSLALTFVFDTFQEKWAYGDRPFLSATSEFPYVGPSGRGWLAPDEDDHVVYFTAEGVVTKKAYPYRTADAPAGPEPKQ